jgi:hypothetical protein
VSSLGVSLLRNTSRKAIFSIISDPDGSGSTPLWDQAPLDLTVFGTDYCSQYRESSYTADNMEFKAQYHKEKKKRSVCIRGQRINGRHCYLILVNEHQVALL